MKNIKNIPCKQLEISCDEYNKIILILENVLNKIENDDDFDNIILNNTTPQIPPIYIYPSVLMLLGESRSILNDVNHWDKVIHNYMIKLKYLIEKKFFPITTSLFGGYSGIGFGIYSLYNTTTHYKKFINSLNKLIIEQTINLINMFKKDFNNLDMNRYDTISGLSGICGYLLLFAKENNEIKECVEYILEYLVSITNDKYVSGHLVPGWYISSENQFLENERQIYKNGNFNFGLSHGVTGILSILSISLKEGIEVSGQKQSINRILVDLKKFNYIDKKRKVYWPDRIKFEDYISGDCEITKSRASWCYGTPGIARALYLAGTAINDKESIDLSLMAIEGLCSMEDKDLMLDSPTFCHGYSGLLAIIQSMYMDTQNATIDIYRKKLLKKLLDFYDKNAIFGFYNIDYEDFTISNSKLISTNNMSLLEGCPGIVLTLLSFIKPIETNWMRHLLIN